MKHLPVGPTRGRQRVLADLGQNRSNPSTLSARAWEKLGVAWICIILCVTTMPWSNFTGHSHWRHVLWVPFAEACLKLWFVGDVIGNILLFLPLGWCLGHARSFRSQHSLRRITLAAFALSLSVEFFQVFSHNRSPAMTDVCTNTAGAVIGALLAARRRRDEDKNITRSEDQSPWSYESRSLGV